VRRAMKAANGIVQHQTDVLRYLKSRFPMYHLSNFFFRDVHFGIRMMLEERGTKLGYTESEEIAHRFVEQLERSGVFTRIDQQSWVVRYPEFKTPLSKAAVPSRPAPAAKPAGPAPATVEASSGQNQS
jgi:hypothetical protein